MPEESPQTRVTLGVLAEALGLSKTSISIALRGHPGVSHSTRARVRILSSILNYRPDPAVTSVSSRRWKLEGYNRHATIAFLCHHSASTDSVQNIFLKAASQRAHEIGYKFESFVVDEFRDADALTWALDARGIQGLLFSPTSRENAPLLTKLKWDRFVAVCCGTGHIRLPLHTISDNTFTHTSMLWEKAVAAGYKRIGTVLHTHNPPGEAEWPHFAASLAAQQVLGIPPQDRVPPMTGSPRNDDLLYQWFRKYKPEVVIGHNDSIGESLHRKGVRFPRDASFLCLMTQKESPWSGIIRNYDWIARTAVSLLATEMRKQHYGLPRFPKTTLIPPEWNQGSSSDHPARLNPTNNDCRRSTA